MVQNLWDRILICYHTGRGVLSFPVPAVGADFLFRQANSPQHVIHFLIFQGCEIETLADLIGFGVSMIFVIFERLNGFSMVWMSEQCRNFLDTLTLL